MSTPKYEAYIEHRIWCFTV